MEEIQLTKGDMKHTAAQCVITKKSLPTAAEY